MLDSLDILIGFALIFTVVSLLVTIVVQMITSLMNLRGRNLAWAVAETFEAIEPQLAASAKSTGKRMADHLLKDPLLSDKQMFSIIGTATAVRPEELFDLLYRIATGKKKVADTEIQAGVMKLFAALGLSEAELKGGTSAPLRVLVDAMPAGPAKVEALAAVVAAEAAAAAGQVQDKLAVAYQQFNAWLQTGQEKAQEWFSMHAQLATFFVGAMFAVVLQLDTIEIFREVSSNRALRNQLVAQTDAVLGQGEKVLQASPGSIPAALATWQKQLPVGKVRDSIEAKPVEAQAGETREALRRRVEQQLGEKLAKSDEGRKALYELEATIDRQVKDDLENLSASYTVMRGQLDSTGFALFPPAWTRWPGKPWTHQIWEHGLGVGFSILLLSLGAPFWFNLLKNLASLRSTVASNIASETKQGTSPSGTPPPTVVPTGP